MKCLPTHFLMVTQVPQSLAPSFLSTSLQNQNVERLRHQRAAAREQQLARLQIRSIGIGSHQERAIVR
jgi:hypothetical protein